MKKLLLLIALIAFAWGAAFLRSGRPVGGEGNVLFHVSEGESLKAIAVRLEEAKLIRNDGYFSFLAKRRGTAGAFKAGSFELSPMLSSGEIERILTQGKPVTNEVQIRILEGWTLNDIADYLAAEGLVSKEEFAAEAGKSAEFAERGALPDWAASYPSLAGRPATASLEGYLFPDTYRVYADAGAKGIVRRMLENFERKLSPELRDEMERRGKSVFEIVTMASVIEREVRGAEDMAMVSDVFWKRVEAGRGMEADSTVNYITGGSKPSVTHAETRIDHPWNTYKYRGLPAGPIGNPGEAALRAAVFPKSNPYWYFLTDPEGTVYYGKTLEEHNANRVNHLR